MAIRRNRAMIYGRDIIITYAAVFLEPKRNKTIDWSEASGGTGVGQGGAKKYDIKYVDSTLHKSANKKKRNPMDMTL